jgi:nicotinamide riboside kinase
MQMAYANIAINNYITGYDLVIYVPIMFPLEDDGLRNKGEEYRELVDGYIKEFLTWNKNVYTIKADGLENRINELIEVINKFKNKGVLDGQENT